MSLTAAGITLVMAMHARTTNASSPNTKDVGWSGGDGAGVVRWQMHPSHTKGQLG